MPWWMWWLVVTFVVHAILVFFMSPPEVVATWILEKFEVHSKLGDSTANVTFSDKCLEGEDKLRFIDNFNQAIFIERYYQTIPKYSGTPVVINTKRGKVDFKLFVFIYRDHVDVFKQGKKKVIAYRLISRSLQEHSILANPLPAQA